MEVLRLIIDFDAALMHKVRQINKECARLYKQALKFKKLRWQLRFVPDQFVDTISKCRSIVKGLILAHKGHPTAEIKEMVKHEDGWERCVFDRDYFIKSRPSYYAKPEAKRQPRLVWRDWRKPVIIPSKENWDDGTCNDSDSDYDYDSIESYPEYQYSQQDDQVINFSDIKSFMNVGSVIILQKPQLKELREIRCCKNRIYTMWQTMIGKMEVVVFVVFEEQDNRWNNSLDRVLDRIHGCHVYVYPHMLSTPERLFLVGSSSWSFYY